MQTAGLEFDAYLQVCFKIFLIINIRNMTLSLLINSMFIFLERKSKISLFFLYPWTDSSLFLSRVLQFLLCHLKFHHYSLSISTMGSTEARTGRLNLIQGRPEMNASPLPGSLGCPLPTAPTQVEGKAWESIPHYGRVCTALQIYTELIFISLF